MESHAIQNTQMEVLRELNALKDPRRESEARRDDHRHPV